MAGLLLIASPACAAPDDGFAAFWTRFKAALAKNDKAAAAAMMKPDTLGLGSDAPKTAAEYYARYFDAKARRCLLTRKPEADGPDLYGVFCGEQIFVFTKMGGVWKFTDIGAND